MGAQFNHTMRERDAYPAAGAEGSGAICAGATGSWGKLPGTIGSEFLLSEPRLSTLVAFLMSLSSFGGLSTVLDSVAWGEDILMLSRGKSWENRPLLPASHK